MQSTEAVKSLAALAQESRLAIFRILVQAGPAGVAAGQLAEVLHIPPSSLSFHMKELTHAGLTSARQAGRFVIYSAQLDRMNDLIKFMTENCCGGSPCSPVGQQACLTTEVLN